jgi:Secretion system C-terminal sorting domain
MRMFTRLFKTVLLVGASVFTGALQSNAGIYTAVASGNYNSPSTWSGGQVPPSNLQADVVVIPSNITVTLTSNQTLNGFLSRLDIDGTLNSSGNETLILTLGTLAGDGVIDVDSLSLGASLGINYTGDIIVDDLTSLGTVLNSSVDITVNSSLNLLAGILDLTAGTINLGSNITLVVDGGDIAVNGGLINLAGPYNVIYRGEGTVTGWELLQAGLNNVTIDVPAIAEIKLDADLKLNGVLNLKSGILILNSHDLILLGNGKVEKGGNGLIHADINADIHLLCDNSLGGLLNFTLTGNIINDLVVDLGNGNDTAGINANLLVNGILDLKVGLLNMHDHILTVNGSILGGSGNSYVVTGDDGLLNLKVTVGGTNLLHVGTLDHYLPVKITPASGSGTVGVGVGADIFVNGNNGTTLGNQPVVDGVWRIVNPSLLNLSVNLMWQNDAEMNGFDRTTCYISQLGGGKWQQGTIGSALPAINGTVGITLGSLVSTDTKLAVFDRDAITTGIKDWDKTTALRLFPNPASGMVHIQAANMRAADIAVTDMTGRTVLAKESVKLGNQPYTLDISALAPGNYFIKMQDGEQIHQSQFAVNTAK